jgi:hypothetical protein
MSTRYLRKTDGSVYVWTEALAKRDDMKEITAAEAGLSRNSAKAKPADDDTSKGAGTGDTKLPDPPKDPVIDPLDITDKAELKKLLAERGVKVTGNPSLTSLQSKLAEALKD